MRGLCKEQKVQVKTLDTKVKKGWVRGNYKARYCLMDGCKVWAIQWQDRKVVSFLTTDEPVTGKVTRKVVDKKTREYTVQEINIPSVYSHYNYGKVGTDRMDHMVGAYYRNTKHR